MFISLKTVLDIYHVKGFYIVSPVQFTQIQLNNPIYIPHGVYIFWLFVGPFPLLKRNLQQTSNYCLNGLYFSS